jgi:hypothetical protein
MIKDLINYCKILQSGTFDSKYYLLNNPDVLEADIDPLLHFVQIGWKEGREPSPHFSLKNIIKQNSELGNGNINSIIQFMENNKRSGHQSQLPSDNITIKKLGIEPNNRPSTTSDRYFDNDSHKGDDDNKNSKQRISSSKKDLVWGLEKEIPSEIIVGNGVYQLIKGWCFVPGCEIKKVQICISDTCYNIRNHSFYSAEAVERYAIQYNDYKNMLFSGFWGMIPFQKIENNQQIEFILRVILKDGSQIEANIGGTTILPKTNNKCINLIGDGNNKKPLVAICMATYNPPIDLFTKQIESLINQTHKNWICIINDDHSNITIFNQIVSITKKDNRFLVFRNSKNIGHYYNFEAALQKVPEEVDYVAYCDQDDEWYPDKICKSLAGFTSEKDLLVYCDMNIVDPEGNVITNTFWTNRRNNYSSFGALLYANTVTGAASIFRASLLIDLLPFPEKIGDDYHDHWTACVALAKGNLSYINEPLYSYIQHNSNAYGIQTKLESYVLIPEIKLLFTPTRNIQFIKQGLKAILEQLEKSYEKYLLWRILISKILLLRIKNMSLLKKSAVIQISQADTSGLGLLCQVIIYYLKKRPTFGYEILALRSFFGHYIYSLALKSNRIKIIERIQHDINQKFSQISMTPIKQESMNTLESEDNMVQLVKQMIAPLKLNISNGEPQRINIIMATVDFKYIFGGYLAMFNLAKKIAQFGNQVRIVIVEPCDYNPEEWRRQIKAYPGLEDFFDLVETSYHFDRSIPLEVNKDDIFIATSCWTAHIANKAVSDMGNEKFIFFAQEYEPIFFPMGTFHALSHQSYFFPQFTIFSTEFLREFFRNRRIGIYKSGAVFGDKNSIVINNAIYSFSLSIEDLKERKKKKFLFYARPESHAARNMYELGILGISDAVQKGVFNEDWEIHGIGTIGNNRRVALGSGKELTLLPKVSLKEYLILLPTYDMGMSLMLSPHPSLVPLEMAAAGMPTITNTCENKTANKLMAISSNLIGIEPTVNGISAGLTEGYNRVNNYKERIAGADVNWPTDWDKVFDENFFKRLSDMVAGCHRK